jgi:hypothetical protein
VLWQIVGVLSSLVDVLWQIVGVLS